MDAAASLQSAGGDRPTARSGLCLCMSVCGATREAASLVESLFPLGIRDNNYGAHPIVAAEWPAADGRIMIAPQQLPGRLLREP